MTSRTSDGRTVQGDPELPSPRAKAVAIGVGATAAVLFVALWAVVALNGYDPLPIDLWWQDVLQPGSSDAAISIAWIPAIVGGTTWMVVIPLVTTGLFFWRRRRWSALNMASAIVVVVAIGAPLAFVLGRVRPSDSLAETVPTSFPSGHTAVATTFVITLGLLLGYWWVWVSGAVWVLLMAWGRTYLDAHWLSDVIAGVLEGTAVATLVWVLIATIRARREAKRDAADTSE